MSKLHYIVCGVFVFGLSSFHTSFASNLSAMSWDQCVKGTTKGLCPGTDCVAVNATANDRYRLGFQTKDGAVQCGGLGDYQFFIARGTTIQIGANTGGVINGTDILCFNQNNNQDLIIDSKLTINYTIRGNSCTFNVTK